MRIGLDFDGVISDCGDLKSRGARQLYGVEIPQKDFKKEIVVGNNWLTPQQYREVQMMVYGSEFGLQMKPVPGSLSYIPKLQQEHQLVVITSRNDDNTLAIAKLWSSLQGLALDFVSVGRSATKLTAATGCNVFVDDDLDKLEPLVGAVPHLFQFGWGYNRHLKPELPIKRIESWDELYREITNLTAP